MLSESELQAIETCALGALHDIGRLMTHIGEQDRKLATQGEALAEYQRRLEQCERANAVLRDHIDDLGGE